MITGLDWIANALVFTGQALAKGITRFVWSTFIKK